MKRVLGLLLALALLAACGARQTLDPAAPAEQPAAEPQEDVTLTLWTYPIGGWGSSSTVSSMITAFRREYPHIQISVHAVDYASGDAEIEQVIAR